MLFSRNRRHGALLLVAALAFVLSGAAIAAPPDTFVTPNDITDSSFWRIDYFDTNGRGDADDPIAEIALAPVALGDYGASALRLDPGPGSGGANCARLGGKTFFGTQDLDGVTLGQIEHLSYEYLVHVFGDNNTYPPGDNNPNIAPYINIFIDRNNDGVFRIANDTILVYDPYYTLGQVTRDTWYSNTVIGTGSVAKWHTAGVAIPGMSAAGSPGGIMFWDDIMAIDLGSGVTVADLPIVNPDPGCDGGATTSDEGTGSGLVFVSGQKSGNLWRSFEGFIDAIVLETDTISQDLNLTLVGAVSATSGGGQTTEAGFAFDNPLKVTVEDYLGNPMQGIEVVFSAPGAGASATFPNGSTAVTDENGVASVAVVANGTVGAYDVTASTDGRTVSFSLENVAQAEYVKQYVLPQDINSDGFWKTDVFNMVPENDVFGAIVANPAGTVNPIAGYGNSSFMFNVGPGVDTQGEQRCYRTGGKVFVGTDTLAGVALKDVKGFAYSFMFADTSIDYNYSAYLNIFIDNDQDGDWEPGVDTILVYDPSRNPNLPGPGARAANTWFDTVAIGPESTGGWITSGAAIPGIPTLVSNIPGIPWNQLVSLPFGSGTVGDLKIINPTAGCDDFAIDNNGPSDDEGTALGFNIQFGQKNGGSYNNGEQHVDKVMLAVHGVLAPTAFDFALFGDPATLTITGGNNQTAHISTAFGTPLSVNVVDNKGNPVEGATVTFTAPGSGASATLSAGGVATTDASGNASVTATANAMAGTYSVTVSVGALSETFTLTNADLPTCTTDCYVDAVAGSPYNSGVDAANALNRIQTAINTVNAGGTVHVAAGTYNESLSVTKAVTILGPNANINPNTGSRVAEAIVIPTAGAAAVDINASNVTVNGFTFTGATGGTTNPVVRSFNNASNNVVVSYNVIEDNVATAGIFRNGGATVANWDISYNRIVDLTNANDICCGPTGILPWKINGLTVVGNVMLDNQTTGINAEAITNALIEGNTITNTARNGLQLSGASGNVTVRGNTVTNTFTDYPNAIARGALGIWEPVKFIGPVCVVGNTFTNSNHGVGVYDDNDDVSNGYLKIVANDLSNNSAASIFFDGTGTLQAPGNYNGGAALTTAGSGTVNAEPFLTVFPPAEVPAGLVRNVNTGEVFCDIQSAINDEHTLDGHTLEISAGTYTEQIIVSKSLTITGAGEGVTVIKLPAAPVKVDGVFSQIRLNSAVTVSISDLTVDGGETNALACNDVFYGIYAYGGATMHLDTVAVTDTHVGNFAHLGCQTGRAIRYGDSSRATPNATGTVNNVTVTRFQKSGIVVDGVGSSVAITNSAVSEGTFEMSPHIAQNGIQFQYGATGSVSNTTVQGMQCTIAVTCGVSATTASGILVYQAGDGIVIDNVTVTNADAAISLYTDSTVSVTNSTLSDSTFYNILNDSGKLTVDGSDLTGSLYGILTSSDPYETSTVVTDSSITNATIAGLFFEDDGAAIASASINDSIITGNGAGISNTSAVTVDATCNFWGTANGPSGVGSGGGDSVSAGVTYSPWRLSSAADAQCAEASLPYKLVKVSGDNQHAVINTAFAAPLVVQVTDSAGVPMEGVIVQFALPSRLPEAIFTPATGEVVTNAAGTASITVTANETYGTYQVAASVGSVFTLFTLHNDPDGAVAPTDLTAVASGATKVLVSWTDTASDIDTLSLERSDDGGSNWVAIHAPANTDTQYEDTGLTCGTAYSYRLIVTNVGGTATSNVATATTNPCNDLLLNGSFEDGLAGNWKAMSKSGDKRKCEPSNPNAFEGDCSLLLKGSADENTVFRQVVSDISALSAGDTLFVSAAFKSDAAAPKVKVRVVLKFAGQPKQKYDLNFQTTSPTFTYGTTSITLDAVPTKVIVQLRNKTKAGKAFLDNVSLTLNDLGTRGGEVEILPPPAAPDGFRGAN